MNVRIGFLSEWRDGGATGRAHFVAEHAKLIDGLKLDEEQKRLLRLDWLDRWSHMDAKAGRLGRWHNELRVIALIGGAIVTGLVGFGVAAKADAGLAGAFAFVVSLVVTASIAIDEYFRFGDRYGEKRRAVDRVRDEGTRYFALAAPYAGKNASHTQQFPLFIAILTRILDRDTRDWVALGAVQPPKPPEQDPDPSTNAT